MTPVTTPTLVYLHGVGQGDLQQEWKANLSATLTRIGYPDLSDVTVITPVYADELKEHSDPQRSLALRPLRKDRGSNSTHVFDFERRIAAMEHRLGRHNRGAGGAFPQAVVNASVALPIFAQARNYVNNTQIRAQVHKCIVDQLPTEGDIVILGHSLGSVIAADLLLRLPEGLTVKGLATIGSPLSNENFNVDDIAKHLKTPPSNLSWWVNFWSGSDPVAAKRGVSTTIPWVLDFRIKTPLIPGPAHSSRKYCADEAVAEAIGFGLFGSRSKEIVLAEKNLKLPLDDTEIFVLQALRYGYLISTRLKGDDARRYAYALRETQARMVAEIKERNARENKPVPAEISWLDFDIADPEADAPIPKKSPYMPKVQAYERLLELVGHNLLQPFEIEVSEKIKREALEDFTSETYLGSPLGMEIYQALHEAEQIVSVAPKTNWRRWGAFGVGAAALTVATGGLALAAAPGVVGAAAITSALASFGPGGMIGGIVTAGTLATVGGGSFTVGALSSVNSSEEVEAMVVHRLSLALLWEANGVDRVQEIWDELANAERTLTRDYTRLKNVSDSSSPILKDCEQQLHTVTRALKYLGDHGMGPGGDLPEKETENAEAEEGTQEPKSVVAPLVKILIKKHETEG